MVVFFFILIFGVCNKIEFKIRRLIVFIDKIWVDVIVVMFNYILKCFFISLYCLMVLFFKGCDLYFIGIEVFCFCLYYISELFIFNWIENICVFSNKWLGMFFFYE